jgi:hypothetical protein
MSYETSKFKLEKMLLDKKMIKMIKILTQGRKKNNNQIFTFKNPKNLIQTLKLMQECLTEVYGKLFLKKVKRSVKFI